MDTSQHNLSTLFDQLGLPSSQRDIDRFIEQHRPLSSDFRLEKATFWTAAQAQFIHEALQNDSDWSEIVDLLNSLLR